MPNNFKRGSFIKSDETVKTRTADLFITFIIALIAPCVFFGFRPLILALSTSLLCVLIDCFGNLLLGKGFKVYDFSSASIGLGISMILPATSPYWLPMVGGIFAIACIKIPFGGTGRSPFSPIAAAAVFLTLCFPKEMFSYPNFSKGLEIPLTWSIQNPLLENSAAYYMKIGSVPQFKISELLMGYAPGPMGTTMCIVLIAAGLYLIVRRSVSSFTMLSFFAGSALMAFLFPRVTATGLESIGYEMFSGSLIFCGVFLITDGASSPKLWISRIIYGFLGGVMVMLIRRYGAYEEGVYFSVLIMNAFSPMIERLGWRIINIDFKKKSKVKELEGGKYDEQAETI